MALRFVQTAAGSLSYWILGIDQSNGSSSYYEDPLELHYSTSQVIFHLPNGMLAFAAADVNGRLSQIFWAGLTPRVTARHIGALCGGTLCGAVPSRAWRPSSGRRLSA